MNPQPKPRPVRCPPYLAWIRAKNCIGCGAPPGVGIEAAHMETGGKGTKGSDYSALPLCHHCHRAQHSMGVLTWAESMNLDIWRECWRLMNEWAALP